MEQVQEKQIAPNKRQTAYMFWISDLRAAAIDTSQQYPSFNIREKNTVRINLIAVVTSKYVSENGSYATLGLDDGTGAIFAKAWNEDTVVITRQEIGNVVLVIGRLGLNSSKEVYVRPEIIRQIEMSWLSARKKELEIKYGQPQEKVSQVFSEDPVSVIEEEIIPVASKSAVRAKVLEILNSSSEGIEELKIVEQSGYSKADAMKAITELVREGEIYYTRPGVLKGL